MILQAAYVLSLLSLIAQTPPATVDLSKCDRTLTKEPAYRGKPRYCLFVFGLNAERRMWVVQDGKSLYADCNGNGDIAEAGERFENIEPIKGRGPNDPIKLGWAVPFKWPEGTQLKIPLQIVSTGPEGILGAILFLEPSWWEVYGLKPPQIVSQHTWCGLTPGEKPSTAPVAHLAGPLTFAREEDLYEMIAPLKRNELQELRVNFGTPGLGKRTFSPVCENALPPEIHPVAEIEFPGKPGAEPIRVTCVLDKRC